MKKIVLAVAIAISFLLFSGCEKSYSSLGVDQQYIENIDDLTTSESVFLDQYHKNAAIDTAAASSVASSFKQLTGSTLENSNEFEILLPALAIDNAPSGKKEEAKQLIHETNEEAASLIKVPKKTMSEVIEMMDSKAYK